GFFFLLALLAYVQFVKAANGKSKICYGVTLFAFVCGLMSKPMLVTFPFILLLMDFWLLNRIGNSGFEIQKISKLIVEKIPFFILSVISCVITFIAQKKGEAVQSLVAFPLDIRIENAVVTYACYLDKCFWPTNLAVFYPY